MLRWAGRRRWTWRRRWWRWRTSSSATMRRRGCWRRRTRRCVRACGSGEREDRGIVVFEGCGGADRAAAVPWVGDRGEWADGAAAADRGDGAEPGERGDDADGGRWAVPAEGGGACAEGVDAGADAAGASR